MNKLFNKDRSTYFEFKEYANLESPNYSKYTSWKSLILMKIN